MGFLSNILISIKSLCFASFSTRGFFLGLSFSFSSPAGCQRSFAGAGIKCSMRSSMPSFDLLTIDLLAISTWWVFGAYTLKYLVILVYSIKIPFLVLLISDLEHFSKRICVLILLPNIWICSRFCLTLAQASSKMMITLSIYFISNRFCK